ncbi:hypothetical protein HIMB100_00011460 [SAR116 cluster alpha proteobacterium HIMB100]|nr:hypothetical protein HIMB100_00011460 [SAR116 cluster alpha proteobacterium HIMB100]
MRALKMFHVLGGLLVLTSCAPLDQMTSFVDRLAVSASSSQTGTQSAGRLTATEDAMFSLQLNVRDVDLQYGDKLNFTAIRMPSWLYLSRDGLLEGTPDNDDVGAHDLLLKVTDFAGQSDELNLTIIVENTNDAPSVVTGALGHATQDKPYEVQLEYADIDIAHGDQLRFSGLSLPGWLNLSSAGRLTGTPSNEDVGMHEVVVEVSDSGKLTAQQSYVIEVKNINDAPTFIK